MQSLAQDSLKVFIIIDAVEVEGLALELGKVGAIQAVVKPFVFVLEIEAVVVRVDEATLGDKVVIVWAVVPRLVNKLEEDVAIEVAVVTLLLIIVVALVIPLALPVLETEAAVRVVVIVREVVVPVLVLVVAIGIDEAVALPLVVTPEAVVRVGEEEATLDAIDGLVL